MQPDWHRFVAFKEGPRKLKSANDLNSFSPPPPVPKKPGPRTNFLVLTNPRYLMVEKNSHTSSSHLKPEAVLGLTNANDVVSLRNL